VGDNIRLRGFSAAGDIYLDGVRIAQYRDTFNYDRVEVLRGCGVHVVAAVPPAAWSTRSANSHA
jgi:outer membrane receptor for monomeric catechols